MYNKKSDYARVPPIRFWRVEFGRHRRGYPRGSPNESASGAWHRTGQPSFRALQVLLSGSAWRACAGSGLRLPSGGRPAPPWISETQSVKLQDAFKVRKQHFDLFTQSARDEIGSSLGNVARQITGFLMDRARDPTRWLARAASRLQFASIAVPFAGPITHETILADTGPRHGIRCAMQPPVPTACPKRVSAPGRSLPCHPRFPAGAI